MKKYFLKLYQYNAWANSRVLGCLQKQQIDDEKILTLMGHVVAAQFLWLHRIKGLPPADVKLWDSYSLSQLTVMADEAGKKWLEFVETENNFDRELKSAIKQFWMSRTSSGSSSQEGSRGSVIAGKNMDGFYEALFALVG